jgi:hypothetical protein
MALPRGKPAGRLETDAAGAELLGVGVNMENTSGAAIFLPPHHSVPDERRLTGFWRMLGLVCCGGKSARQI